MSWLVPGLIALLLIISLTRGADVYGAFVRGAEKGLPMLLKILPCMAAMLAAIKVMRASGAMDALITLVSPALSLIGLSPGLAPLFILRPFSGSAAMSLLQDVFDSFGPDGFEGIAGSIMLGSTETIFYTVALYFGSVGVKRTRYSVPVALICALIGAILAVVATRVVFAL